ncbi:hypothetical protein M406DRAFT_354691, partial [Cryphonectria parasitica EP155]
MQLDSRLSLAAVSLGSLAAVRAAPTVFQRDTPGAFLDLCSDISFMNGWLVGTCSSDNGTSITSSVWLSSLIELDDNTLVWAENGNYYASCVNGASGYIDNSTLVSQCVLEAANISIDLAEHVFVYDGFLLSDLAGTPTGPTVSSSTISVPTSSNHFAYQIYFFNKLLSRYCSDFGTEDAAFGVELYAAGPQDCHSFPLADWVTSNGWYAEPPPFVAVVDYLNYGWQVS